MATQDLQLQHIKVMIIDDHDPIRKAMKRILAQMGISFAVECFDGEEALREITKQPDIDLVLCDLYMRKVDGFQVLTHIRNRTIGSDIPFIVVTGEANKDDIVKASDLGADDYIIKPFHADSMITKIQQVLAHFHSPPPLVKALREGDRAMLNKRFNEALQIYQRALNLDPRSMRAKHSIAVALDHCGKQEDAIKLLQQNIEMASSYYKNYSTLANIHLKRQDLAEAIKAMKKELELNPKQTLRQVQLAKLLLRQGEAMGAINHYREALRENSRNRAALLGIGQAFAQLEDLEKATYYFKRHRRYFPDDSSPLQAIVKICMQAGEPRRAEIALRDEKQLHPERKDTYVCLTKLYMATGRNEAALETLDALFELDPEHCDGLKLRGQLEMKQKNFAAALKTFTLLVKKSPDLNAYICQAECMQQVKRIKTSIEVLHRALVLAPGHPHALFLLATAYKKTKQYSKAILIYLAAKKAGVSPEKCAKNMKMCWAQIKLRRDAAFKMSA